MKADNFIDFVLARHAVYVARAAGQPKPWTTNPILQQYRFCNVYRELDKVTVWVRENWREQYGGDPDFWFSMVIARLFNRPESLQMVQPLPWRPSSFQLTLETMMARGEQVFSAAYIVSTNGVSMPKVPYLVERVLNPMWAGRKNLRPEKGEELAAYHARLGTMPGMGSFMAAQVVADMKNEPRCGLWSAPDWWSWASPGPGSMRGLNRILGRGGVKTGYKPGAWLQGVNALQEQLNPVLTAAGYPAVCAHDLQNCLCEYDKYERVRLGEGRPKQGYPGTNGDLF